MLKAGGGPGLEPARWALVSSRGVRWRCAPTPGATTSLRLHTCQRQHRREVERGVAIPKVRQTFTDSVVRGELGW
jgi:hypothetical protein